MSVKQVNEMKDRNITFEDIFNLEDIQRLQKLFSDATGVASIITKPDGTPITEASNFCKLCNLIRRTDKGREACFKSDAFIGSQNTTSPIVQKCLSAGLWDSGVSITVGGVHIANWLIGQVRDKDFDMEQIINKANDLGIDKNKIIKVWEEVPVMSIDKFKKISEMLFAFVTEQSEKAYQNLQLKKLITDHEQAALLLKQSEEKYSAIFENVQDVFYQTDLQGIVLEISPSIKYFSEFNPNEIIGKNVSTLYNNINDRIILLKAIEEKGELRDYEILLKTKTGKKVYVSINARLVTDSNGKPNHIDGALRDISKRKIIEQDLLKSKTALIEAQTVAEIGSWEYDLVKDQISWSQEMFHIHDIDPASEPLHWKEHQQIIHPDDWERIDKKVQTAIQKGISFHDEIRIIKKQGKNIWVEARGNIYKDDSGNIIKLSGTIQNINDRKQAEEDLKNYKEHLEEIIKHRTHELEVKNAELERFNSLFIGRDFRIKELRDRVKELEELLGEKNYG